MKTRWLIALALVVVMAIGALGANAYFTSEAQTLDSTFTSGTLTLTLSNDNITFGTPIYGTWVTPADWAPGDTVTALLYLKNSGTIDAAIVDANWVLGGDTMLGNAINVVSIVDQSGTTDMSGWTLGNLAGLSSTMDGWFWDDSGVYIEAGQTESIQITFEFDPDAGNEYQGKTLDMDLYLTAKQIATH